jgi:hypothetical protein
MASNSHRRRLMTAPTIDPTRKPDGGAYGGHGSQQMVIIVCQTVSRT